MKSTRCRGPALMILAGIPGSKPNRVAVAGLDGFSHPPRFMVPLRAFMRCGLSNVTMETRRRVSVRTCSQAMPYLSFTKTTSLRATMVWRTPKEKATTEADSPDFLQHAFDLGGARAQLR